MPSRLLLSIALPLGAFCSTALADTPEIVVTARPTPLAAEAAYDVLGLDQAALDDRAGGAGLDEVLEEVAGFSLFRRQASAIANPTAQGASLRGVGPNGAGRTLVTLDGVPVGDPFGGWVAWSALPPVRIGAAEVRRGGGVGAAGPGPDAARPRGRRGCAPQQGRTRVPRGGATEDAVRAAWLRGNFRCGGERIGARRLAGDIRNRPPGP